MLVMGSANEHNALIPRDHWLEDWEKRAIIDFFYLHPLEGYRRMTFMMLDVNVVAVSPASVYRVLRGAGLIDQRGVKSSKKGTGFLQPLAPRGPQDTRTRGPTLQSLHGVLPTVVSPGAM
jgi:putative transposase